MKGLDLRRLKKMSSDDKTTVFKHDNGHELKIAHAGLSPSMLKELQGLPMHGKPQKMAEGGKPNPQPNPSPDDDSGSKPQAPVTIYVGGQPQQPAQPPGGAVPAPYTPGVSDPGPQATNGVNPNNAQASQDQSGDSGQPEDSDDAAEKPDQAAAVPAPASAPTQPNQPPTAGKILTEPTSADEALAHLNEQTDKLKQDFDNGHITPKTMHDFWAKNRDGSDRGTLGKIGLFFSMLAGGMGSGLTHQPNVILGAMQKEIDNDLEAQKQTKSNQYSALNLAENHYRNEVQSHLTKQQANLTGQQAALAKVNTEAASIEKAKQVYRFGLEQHINKMSGMVPENTPAGQKARAAAGLVSNAITSENALGNQRLAKQIEANGQQAQQGSAQNNAPQGGGELLKPDATPEKMFGLTSKYSESISDADKSEINKQYQSARGTEAAISQMRKLFPEARQEATASDIYGESLSSLQGGIGSSAKQFTNNIFGGNQGRQFTTTRESLKAYMTKVLTELGETPTNADSASEGFMPAYGDDDKTYNGRVNKAIDKIVSMARAKYTKLDALGLLK